MTDPLLTALAGTHPDRDDENLCLEFGIRLFQLIAAKHGEDAAREFVDAIVIPTLPRTPERARQDGADMALEDLLEAIAP